MIVMLLGMSGWFLYDGMVEYPKKKAAYDIYWPQYEALKAEGKSGEWPALAEKNGWPTTAEQSDWNYKIKEQYGYSIVVGTAGLVWLVFFLRNKGRKLLADATSLTLPDGKNAPFAAVKSLDKRKWPHKGLAYIKWTDAAGNAQTGCIDDFIFAGADKVLARLERNFKGELIELAVEEKPDTASAEPAEQQPQEEDRAKEA